MKDIPKVRKGKVREELKRRISNENWASTLFHVKLVQPQQIS